MTSNGLPANYLAQQGFVSIPKLITPAAAHQLAQAIEADTGLAKSTSRRGADYAARNLMANAAVAEFSRSPAVLEKLGPFFTSKPFPVRAILFDKVQGGNWRVGWHQDQMIPVRERIDTPGFTAWSEKAGVPHVRPPAGVLEGMLTIRLHLDDCGPENGPLQVLPGSHRHGFLASDSVKQRLAKQETVSCTATRGDALLMRPLLLHASSKAISPSHRRVLHIEYACERLPGELEWPSLS